MGEIIIFLVGLGIAVVLFLVFRSVILWYWNVNRIVQNQERTNELLCKVVNSLERQENKVLGKTETPVV